RRTVGRLPRRGLGQLIERAMASHRARRCRGRVADRGGDRRRHAAKALAGKGGARQLHARERPGTAALAEQWRPDRFGFSLQHLWGSTAVARMSDARLRLAAVAVGWVELLREPIIARADYSCRFAHCGSSGSTSDPHRGSYAPRSTHCKKLECG